MARFKVSFTLTLDGTVDAEDVASYVHDAVKTHGGAYPPDDTFFGLDDETITKMKVRGLFNNKGDDYNDE